MGIIVPAFYIYMWLLFATAWLCLTIGVSLAIYDGIKYIWSRLF